MSREEMDLLGWDSCDIIIVTGDAYVDHASFGMALIGRLLEAQGFRVGIIAQPDWTSAEAFRVLGPPNLFFGIGAGNMDSMVNRYTADRCPRSDDAYSPGAAGGRRPDRSVLVYAQRAREAYKEVPILLGGIEASLRRVAHYDYWSDQVRRSVLVDSKADLLLYGNAERAICEIAHRLARGEPIGSIRDVRGTAFLMRPDELPAGWTVIDATDPGGPSSSNRHRQHGPAASAESDPPALRAEPTMGQAPRESSAADAIALNGLAASQPAQQVEPVSSALRLPAFEQVRADPMRYAHAARLLHLETNPGNARALVQAHGDRDLWLNPPPIPLTTAEMDRLYELPFARRPHTSYGDARIPAWEMIRFSVTIMRGCFGGCSFCSITEHEGRIIQSRSEASVLAEIEDIRDRTPGFTGTISDLGGPSANMYRLACREPAIESACRRLSCVFPEVCKNLSTDHSALIQLYRKARAVPGVKRVLIASGLRYDLAVHSPAYVRELVTHHVGGYLKIAPEHTEPGPLAKMLKPGIGSFERFRQLFEQFSREAGKEQYLIPYFIAAHPGTSDQDMLNLALWLKRNRFRPDQVQGFLPTPMALATAMYHSGWNPLHPVRPGAERVSVVRGQRQRRLHKAFLRWHDPENWPLLRDALRRMGRADLIGNGKQQLVPSGQPVGAGESFPQGRQPRSAVRPSGKRPQAAGRRQRLRR
ncbi:MAG: YgiQ family radical SAM protein [Halochromatium sp.]|nr:YgiQ family radical SAM protein [Halochromatium sp.]